MQEEVEQKTVALAISAGKLTGRELKKAIVKLLAHMKAKKNHPNIPQGKQSVKQLAKQGQGMTSIEITDQNIKDFERVARKYGILLMKSGSMPLLQSLTRLSFIGSSTRLW